MPCTNVSTVHHDISKFRVDLIFLCHSFSTLHLPPKWVCLQSIWSWLFLHLVHLMLSDSSYKCLMLFLFFFLILLIKQVYHAGKIKPAAREFNFPSSFLYISLSLSLSLPPCVLFFLVHGCAQFRLVNGKWSWNWKGVQSGLNNSHFVCVDSNPQTHNSKFTRSI